MTDNEIEQIFGGMLVGGIQADRGELETKDGIHKAFLVRLVGATKGNPEATSQTFAFLDFESVMHCAQKMLEWGAEAFGVGVKVETYDMRDAKASAVVSALRAANPEPDTPAKTGQYL